MVSFEEGHELLHELAGVDVPTKHVERAAEALGREVAEDEKLVVEPPEPNEPLAPTLYLGMDGTGVPVRKKELVDRPGKQPDGSSKTREVKLVTIWSAEKEGQFRVGVGAELTQNRFDLIKLLVIHHHISGRAGDDSDILRPRPARGI